MKRVRWNKMEIKLKLTDNLNNRNAANLVNSLRELSSSVFIYKDSGRKVNGKTLVGLLSENFLKNEIINVNFSNLDELSRL
jgi:phosphotransferase system HPr-like phosphotransfer protein